MRTTAGTIKIKSLFGKWRDVSKDEALCFARWKFVTISMGTSDKERLLIVNSRLQGVQFTIGELR